MPEYPSAPVIEHREGEPRRVGVEIEFAGPGLGAVSDLVAATFEGEVSERGRHRQTVTTPMGEFRIEVDVELLHELAERPPEEGALLRALREVAQDLLEDAAEGIAPLEVVSPPLQFERIADMDRLCRALSDAGAEGTDDAFINAFGVHFNPELPDDDPHSIGDHIRAYALLDPWLREVREVDASRRITPFIDPYPGDYLALILEPGYQRDLIGLIDDYLAHNPTRNRALDMLPSFSHLDPDRVAAEVDDPKVKARPTFHYRLANCRIGHPDWSVTDEWRCWLLVEHLAADGERLEALCAAVHRRLSTPLGEWIADWKDIVEDWVSEHG